VWGGVGHGARGLEKLSLGFTLKKKVAGGRIEKKGERSKQAKGEAGYKGTYGPHW